MSSFPPSLPSSLHHYNPSSLPTLVFSPLLLEVDASRRSLDPCLMWPNLCSPPLDLRAKPPLMLSPSACRVAALASYGHAVGCQAAVVLCPAASRTRRRVLGPPCRGLVGVVATSCTEAATAGRRVVAGPWSGHAARNLGCRGGAVVLSCGHAAAECQATTVPWCSPVLPAFGNAVLSIGGVL